MIGVKMVPPHLGCGISYKKEAGTGSCSAVHLSHECWPSVGSDIDCAFCYAGATSDGNWCRVMS